MDSKQSSPFQAAVDQSPFRIDDNDKVKKQKFRKSFHQQKILTIVPIVLYRENSSHTFKYICSRIVGRTNYLKWNYLKWKLTTAFC